MSKPICTIIAGPDGAGKTTFALEYLPLIDCRVFLNADMIAADLAPLRAEEKLLEAGKLFYGKLRDQSEKEKILLLRLFSPASLIYQECAVCWKTVGALISFISGCPVWRHQ